jgi:hypothetical protein
MERHPGIVFVDGPAGLTSIQRKRLTTARSGGSDAVARATSAHRQGSSVRTIAVVDGRNPSSV